jgi:quercetin dioxygenase-like cupin family protein
LVFSEQAGQDDVIEKIKQGSTERPSWQRRMVRDNAGRTFRNPHLRQEREGHFTAIEVVADPRNGAPVHIQRMGDEHLVVLEGTLYIA